MLIYVPINTPRVSYTFDLLLNEILGIPYQITVSIEEFKNFNGQKFVYSPNSIDDSLYFPAHPLLFEEDIKTQKMDKIDWEDCIGLFEISRCPFINFDLFASAFYLVSRYEEYLPHHVDKYNRFGSSVSIAYTFQFLRKPMVNYYVRQLNKILENHFGKIETKKTKFKLLLTYDIDNAYEYKGKNVMQHTYALGRYLMTAQFKKFFERIGVILTGNRDPFDTFLKMDKWHKKYNVYPIYFFLLAIRRTNYDTNIKYNSKELRKLIELTSASYEIGAHPSFNAGTSLKTMQSEIKLLRQYSDKDVFRSRQHFLRLSLPETYYHLMQCNITEDYTMGYSSRPGFRASICQPFYWYDLRNEKKTTLRIFPFAFMDATFKYYKRYRSEKIRERLFELYHETKQFNGTFVTVFHNDILAEERYSKIYEGFLSEVS